MSEEPAGIKNSDIFNLVKKAGSQIHKTSDKFPVYLGLGVIVLFLITASLAPSISKKLGELARGKTGQQSFASENKEENQQKEPTFSSNELLIKVKKEARGKVKENNPADTGIASLNQINKDLGIKKFEKVAKAGKDSKVDHDLFSWYLVTMDIPAEKIVGKLNKESKQILSVPSSKNSPSESNNRALISIQKVIDKLKSDPNIETVDLNYTVNVFQTPNDPYYSSVGSWGQPYDDLWGIKKINAASAWDQATGSASIIVADIDTGVDRNHEDLQGQMWVNTAETPGNGIDDDANGYVDDYYGWNWVANNGDPMDDMGHGTHTVGTIAGVGNNGKGVVGVNWTSKIMALKFLGSDGNGYMSNGLLALQYAADMGARVSSNSWGCACGSQAMDDAIKYEHDRGMVVVTAAGNSNSDALDFSPAQADHVITVAASNSNDARSCYSNFGEKIDVAAPGGDSITCGGIPNDNILSLKAAVSPLCTSARTVGANYCRVSGTSMAAPHVAGLAALLLAKNPNLTNEEVRQILRQGADDLGSSGKDSSFGYGRINAANTMNFANTHPLTPFITSPRSRTTAFGTNVQVIGRVPGPNFQSYKIEVGAGNAPISWTTLTTSNAQPATDTVLTTIDTTKFNDGANLLRLTATDSLGKTYQFQVNIAVDNFDMQITSPYNKISQGINTVYGYVVMKNGLTFSNYKLEWGEGTNPATWSTAGTTLDNSGTREVPIDDWGGGFGPGFTPLGTWNTSSLTDGKLYTLRLTVTSSTGSVGQTTTFAYVDKDIAPGWPKVFCKSTPISSFCKNGGETMPVMADLDGDGQKEIIVPQYGRKLYVFRKDGTNFPGFPVSVDSSDQVLNFGINVDDLDGDGKKEIILTAFNSAVGWTSRIYIFKSDGTRYSGWPIPTINSRHSLVFDDSTATIGDLNGDGKKELVFVERVNQTDGFNFYVNDIEDRINAFQLDGTQIAGFPKTFTHPVLPNQFFGCGGGSCTYGQTSTLGGLSIADVDKDGKTEILFGYGDRIYLFDNQGNLKSGWPFVAPTSATSLVCTSWNGCPIKMFTSLGAVGDIDGDGTLEIFMYGHDIGTNAGGVLYGLKNDGTALTGWPKTYELNQVTGRYANTNTPLAVDLDRDGKDEIIIAGIRIFNTSGDWSFTQPISARYYPIVSDLDGDGKFEFLAQSGSSSELHGFFRRDGSIYFEKAPVKSPYDLNYGEFFDSPSVIADMDNDGKMEWVVGVSAFVNVGSGYGGSNNSLYIWQVPNSTGNRAQYEWLMFGHDPARTGRLQVNNSPSPSPTPTITPSPSPSTIPSPSPVVSPTPTPSPLPPPPGDTTPPVVSVSSPASGAVLTRNSTITLSASASDNIGVAKVEFYANGGLICSDSSSPYSCSWKVPGKPNATHTIEARAYDAAGNWSFTRVTVKTSK